MAQKLHIDKDELIRRLRIAIDDLKRDNQMQAAMLHDQMLTITSMEQKLRWYEAEDNLKRVDSPIGGVH